MLKSVHHPSQLGSQKTLHNPRNNKLFISSLVSNTIQVISSLLEVKALRLLINLIQVLEPY